MPGSLADRASPAAPPVWCLPAGALLAATALVPFLPGFLANEGARDRLALSRQAQWERILQPRQQPGEGPLRVLAMGDSLLLRAVPPDGQMEGEARARGLDLMWRLLGHGGFDWDSSGILEAAVAARPDLLLVQANMLFYTPRAAPSGGDPLHVHGFHSLPAADASAGLPLRFLGHVRGTLRRAAGLTAQVEPDRPRPGVDEELRTHGEFKSALYGGPDGRYLQAFAEARRRGTTVIVVVMPIHTRARSVLAEPAEIGPVLAALETSGLLQVWRCPLSFEAGEFAVDLRHLEENGRARYTAWLLGRLAQWRLSGPAAPEPRLATAP